MNSPAVNLGAGGFVSYYEDGGATVVIEDTTTPSEAQEFEERGVGSFFKEQILADMGFLNPMGYERPDNVTDFSPQKRIEIRKSGNPGSAARETYYGDNPTFFETLASDYDYPLVEDYVSGPNRHGRPAGRPDLPTPQELADARGHGLGTAMVAADYGPKTAEAVGAFAEDFSGSNRLHRAMDKRNNAVGAAIFKQAGIQATPEQLSSMVDAEIFRQLDVIMGRPANEREFKSPEGGMDLYFPRDEYGYFLPDH
tara:strand:+ start:2477 stop:3238 length:762 start_codon:yes stop_codon:yes gene_type:complete